MRRLIWYLAVGLALTFTAAHAQFGLNVRKVLHPEISFSPPSARPGQEITVLVTAKIEEGWHAYTNKPPEELGLIPTEVTLELPEGWKAGEVTYPEGDPLVTPLSEEPIPLYHGQVVFRLPLQVPASAKPAKYPIRAQVRYQACDDSSCLPPTTVDAQASLEVAPGDVPQAKPTAEASNPAPSPPAAGSPRSGSLPSPRSGAGSNSAAPPETPRQVIPIPIKSEPEFPQEATLTASPPAPAARPTTEPSRASIWDLLTKGDIQTLSGRLGPVVIHLAIFLLGLLLNLTPCVWPVIPITIGYFSHQSSGESRRALGLAALYVLGIAVTYSILGVVAALSGGLFGQALQKPWVTLLIVQVLVALALSSFGLFELRLPIAFSGNRQRGALLESLLMGLMVGLVAAPCVGPVIISLLIWVAERQSLLLGFSTFFVLALGMGLPYLILGAAAGSAKVLPKSGDWMGWVKKLLGFIILGVAIYFLEPLLVVQTAKILYVELALAAALVLAVLDHSGRDLPRFRYIKWTAGGISLALAIWLAVPQTSPPRTIAWEPFTQERLTQAQREKKPVVVDFRADWCIPCRRMERTIFADRRVVEASSDFVMLKADVTRSEDPEVVRLQQQFKVRGVPTVLFFDRQGNEVERVTKVSSVEGFLESMNRAR